MTTPFLREPLLRDFAEFARWRLAGAMALVVVGALLEGAGILLLVPIVSVTLGGGSGAEYIAPFFDLLGTETKESRLIALLVVFGVMVALRFVVQLSRDYVMLKLSQDFITRLRSRAFRSLAAKPWPELARLQQGPIGHALTRDVDRAEGGVTIAVRGGMAALILVIQLAMAFALSPIVTIVAILAGLGAFRLLRWLRQRATHLGKRLSEEDLSLYSSTQSFLSGLKPAKAHGMEGDYVAAFEGALVRRRRQVLTWMMDNSLASLLLQSGAALIAAMAIVAGVFWLDQSAEILIVTVLILSRVYSPVLALQQLVQGVRHAASGYRVARDLAEGPLSRNDPTPGPSAPPLSRSPEIRLEDVTVLSDESGGRPLLADVDCVIPAGKVTALIGPSGAGKTTLSDLVIGLLRPDSGRVLLDGAEIDQKTAARLAASLAYVGQESFMLARSLRDNLRWGNDAAEDEALLAALELTNARHLVDQLEGGLDGWVRTEGTRFSGGERQRLRLARAWLRRPRLMVLDEATNALDVLSEQAVLDRVLDARNEATVLMITHRPATALRADHLIMLEEGRVMEAGPPAVLAEQPGGAFESLFNRAMAG